MNINKANVYDLENAVIASGYPKQPQYIERLMNDITQKDYERASRLACVPGAGTGHDNFLKGILVSMDVTATLKWWIQAQRYSHFTIVSSMSTMHMAEHMPLRDMCKRLPEPMLSALVHMQDDCINGRISREDFLYALPVGLEYTARVTTNYMQLKTMYRQRRNHRLQEWQQFCDWCEGLSHAEWIVGKEFFSKGQSAPFDVPHVDSSASDIDHPADDEDHPVMSQEVTVEKGWFSLKPEVKVSRVSSTATAEQPPPSLTCDNDSNSRHPLTRNLSI